MEPPKAIFSFENYRISSFSFREPSPESAGLGLTINPSGIFSNQDKLFQVKLAFQAFEMFDTPDGQRRSTEESIKVEMTAFFRFSEDTLFGDIPDFFYINSVAIAFPYLRAFLSSLTSQANVKTLILPVLNLTGLDKPLKENTVSV